MMRATQPPSAADAEAVEFEGRIAEIGEDGARLENAHLQTLLSVGALRPTRRTADGRVTEYELTHLGRTLLTRSA